MSRRVPFLIVSFLATSLLTIFFLTVFFLCATEVSSVFVISWARKRGAGDLVSVVAKTLIGGPRTLSFDASSGSLDESLDGMFGSSAMNVDSPESTSDMSENLSEACEMMVASTLDGRPKMRSERRGVVKAEVFS